MTPEHLAELRRHVAGNESIGPIVGALLDEIDRLEAERNAWSAEHGKLAGKYLDLKAKHESELGRVVDERAKAWVDLEGLHEEHDLALDEWAKERAQAAKGCPHTCSFCEDPPRV